MGFLLGLLFGPLGVIASFALVDRPKCSHCGGRVRPNPYVSKDDPPVLTLHGDQDTLAPIEQATLLDEKMKAAGASHTLMIFEGQGHGFGGEAAKKAVDATWEFFD